jgi:SAM-dependent methyltransferase
MLVVEGDLYSEPLGKESAFDIVFSRLVLMHLDDRKRGLQQMFTWVKPGGCLIVQDYQFSSIDAYPPYWPVAELKRAFHAVYVKAGRETQMGLKLPAAFIDAGMGTPDGTDVTGFLLPMPTIVQMFGAVYRSILPKALEFGITTKEESDSFFAEIERAPADSYAMWPLLVTAWRRKPV